jgi:hypothetical protein
MRLVSIVAELVRISAEEPVWELDKGDAEGSSMGDMCGWVAYPVGEALAQPVQGAICEGVRATCNLDGRPGTGVSGLWAEASIVESGVAEASYFRRACDTFGKGGF